MNETTATISNKLGLHARASAKLTKLAGGFRLRCAHEPQRPAHQCQEHHGRDDAGGRHRAATSRSRPTAHDEAQALAAIVALIDDRFGEGQ